MGSRTTAAAVLSISAGGQRAQRGAPLGDGSGIGVADAVGQLGGLSSMAASVSGAGVFVGITDAHMPRLWADTGAL